MRLLERILLLVLLAACGAVHADPTDLKPFRATYTAEWKGISAANSTVELRSAGADTYTYSSVNTARGLFRMPFPDALTQISTFKVIDGLVVPMSFKGIDEKERPIDLTFDWQKKRVTGVAKEKAVDLPLPDGAQDASGPGVVEKRHEANGGNAAGTL